MAAPIIISKRNFGGLQSLPNLSQGERVLNAEVNAANQEASARINAVQRETAAEIGVGRAITGEAMRGSEAFTKFAGTVDRFTTQLGNQVLEAVQQTQVNEAQAKRQRLRSEAFSAFEQDPDWKGAPDRLRQKFTEIDNDAFQGFGATQIAAMKAQTLRSDLSMERQLNTRSFGKMVNAAQAADIERETLWRNQASRAASGPERLGVITDYERHIDEQVNKGIYEQTQGVQKKQAFRQNLDQTDLQKGLAKDPAATLKALDDASMFPTFTEEQRVQAKELAKKANDTLQQARAGDQYDRDPVAASATYARKFTVEMMTGVVKRATIPGESSGNPNAQSDKGAAGITQFMPDTARGIARRMGMSDLLGLDDDGVRAWLKANPESAIAMSARMLTDDANRYGGLAPAFAAYHAGRGGYRKDGTYISGADDWHKAAVEKYGPGYSAAEFISVIPDSRSDGHMKTKDYVAAMMRRVGADVLRGGVSELAAYRVADAIEGKAQTERAQAKADISKLISLGEDDRSTLMGQLKSGLAFDPSQVMAIKAPLEAGAALGDVNAIKELRRVNEAIAVFPIVQDAYQSTPQQLEARITQLQASAAAAPLSPAQTRMLETLQGVHSEMSKRVQQNPIGLFQRRSGQAVPPVPVDSGPAQIADALQARQPMLAQAQRVWGQEAQRPLMPAEASALKQRWDQAQDPERLDLLRAFRRSSGDGRSYDALIEQVGVDKISATAGHIAAGDPELARSVLRGAAILKQKGVDDGKASELREALKNTLGGTMFKPELQDDLVNAALARYVDLRGGAGTLFDATDPRGLQSAIEDIVGKMTTINGGRVPGPRGVSPGRFDAAWAAATPADIAGGLLGREGQPLPGAVLVGRDGQALDFAFVKAHARLKPAGVADGRYFVVMPGPAGQEDRSIRGGDGQQIVFDISPVLSRLQSVFPPETDMRMLPGAAPARPGAIAPDPFLSMPRLIDKPAVMP